MNRWLGNAGVKVGYATWDTGRVSTSWWKAGEHTHGAVGRIVDMNEIYARKPAFGQEYDYDTMWNNFEYFLRAALPGVQGSRHEAGTPSLRSARALL